MSSRILLISVCLGLSACGPKLVREEIFESEKRDVRVELVRSEKDGEPIDRGYAHPATIADVRLAHILASISHKDKDDKSRPTIKTGDVYTLAEGIAKAIEKATPADEVVAAAFSRVRRFAVFSEDRVTSFHLYFKDEALVIEFYAIDELFEKKDRWGKADPYLIPYGPPQSKIDARLEAGPARAVEARQRLIVDWRDDFFAKPVALSVRMGKIRRRSVLMQASDEDPEPEVTERYEGLSDAQTSALDQLDATRRAGLVTEAEFLRRRRLVLENKLEEAGYGEETP